MSIFIESPIITFIVFALLLCPLLSEVYARNKFVFLAVTYSYFHSLYDLVNIKPALSLAGLYIPVKYELQSYRAMFLLGAGSYFATGISIRMARAVLAGIFWVSLGLTFYYNSFGQPKEVADWGSRLAGGIWTPSMNAALLCLTLPFVPKFRTKFILDILLIALAVHVSSTTAILVYFATKLNLIHSIVSASALALGLMVSPVFIGSFLGSDRLEFYRFFFDGWKEKFSWLFGAGANTFEIVGPALQCLKSFHVNCSLPSPGALWTFAHSDWFEILFNLGIIGLIFWLAVYFHALFSKKMQRDFKSGALGLGVFMLSYFPMHASLSILSGILIGVPLLKRGK